MHNNNIYKNLNPKDLYRYIVKNIRYSTHTKLKSVRELMESGSGSCHDQSYFIHKILKINKIKSTVLFMIESNENGEGGETHSFTVYYEKDKIIWVETAWVQMRGFHTFRSLQEIKNKLIKMHKDGKWGNYNKYPTLEIAVMKASPGDTLNEIVQKTFNL